jgi:hypothetical protein
VLEQKTLCETGTLFDHTFVSKFLGLLKQYFGGCISKGRFCVSILLPVMMEQKHWGFCKIK